MGNNNFYFPQVRCEQFLTVLPKPVQMPSNRKGSENRLLAFLKGMKYNKNRPIFPELMGGIFVKKLLTVALVILLLTGVLSLPVSAAEKDVPRVSPELDFPVEYKATVVNPTGKKAISDYMTKAIEDHLLSGFSQCKSYISIYEFGIPVDGNMADQLKYYIWYELPEAFNVYGLGVGMNDGKLEYVSVSYRDFADTPAEYASCKQTFDANAAYLLRDIENNKYLTDVEKALLLHDRLAIWTEYDYDNYIQGTLPKSVYTAYGALGNQKAVCQGYAMAYMYLLKRVGIESDYCSSEMLDHGWNIVYIDGKPYHVDVTWDDPVYDKTGYVEHYNFLRSTEGIREEHHHGTDFITTPTSILYDSYYWQDCNSSFVLVNNELYYIDTDDQTLRKAEGEDTTTLCSVAAEWETKNHEYWTRLACLGATEELILFSQPEGIYAYDPAIGQKYSIYSADRSQNPYWSVYGFKYEKGYLVCDLADTYRQDGTSKDNQIKIFYEEYSNPRNGWVTINDKHYYYVNDVAQTGWLKLDGKWYYFNAQGAMQTGWVSVAGTWYYLNAAGVMQTGWIYNGGAWYYLKSSGAMQTGWLQQGSTWYYLKTSGAMVTGNYTIGTAVHKFNSSGVWLGEVKQTQKNGWVQESGKWYYYQNGSMAKGWKQVGGVWYYFKANGQMTTGWLQQGSTWYYLQSSGAMKTGWLQLGSTWYYFHSSGAMATGWLQQGNVWYFFDPSGAWVQR